MEIENKPQVKKEWTKPELTVLVRSEPEESVLTACKYFNRSGYENRNNVCQQMPCAVCNAQAAS